ncbi:small GTP-binding protein, putative [Trichomonas vaginalis G3]|uniref:Small GTP-binding protein, putative n=1 Tax=Trichomonas vaginalis (strain ATCC PRA-98 / G3) TaxID=412133 RepID=A2E2M2_TRIV3|nr:GTPase protein [Trichomonas vaginalis G3]EAY13050.1 small GTP-binding protein, putative [Trichomonas vaginalis G3]KAI5548238.1 GTPase protein [Trichomonas vaginalis G3]|eukprot:XP_001325273.1 small GTP-binding protein [Trichomonas vaginalis G3]
MSEIKKETPTLKCIVVGSSGVGKTSLIEYLINGKFNENTQPTIAVDYKTTILEIDGQEVKMNIYDTAGQEKYKALSRSYFRKSDCVLLVFDLTEKQSYDDANAWYLEILQNCDFDSKILLVGNKADEINTRVISNTTAELYAKSRNIIYIETSAKTGENVREAFFRIACEAYRSNEKEIHDDVPSLTLQSMLMKKCC